MQLSADHLLQHAKHPEKFGELAGANVHHSEKNPSCGDHLTVHLQVEDGTLKDLRWQGEGCAISQGTMSIISESLVGKSESEILALTPETILDQIGLPISPRRLKCALLSLHTVQNAIRGHQKAPQWSWVETLENA